MFALLALGSAGVLVPGAVAGAAQRTGPAVVPIPTSGAWFGSTTGMDNGLAPLDQQSDLSAHQDLVGRKFAAIRDYFAWDEAFPTDYTYYLKDQGQIPVLSWKAGMVDRVHYARWADIAAGVYDSTIDARAADIKAYQGQIYLAFHHEPEPCSCPDYGTAAEFVAAWKHIHDRFATDGVTNVSWILILLSSSYSSGLADSYYPGDSYVNVLGVDGYNWYGCASQPDADWRAFSEIFTGAYTYSTTKGKPLFVTEYGVGEDPLDPTRKAQWFTDELATLKTWPNMKAVLYYDHNEDDTCVFWVGSSSAALAAYQALGADPYLNPPPPLTWITSGPEALTNSTTATFGFTVSGTLPTTSTCQLDSQPAAPCVLGVTYKNLADGPHTETITSTDLDGNVGTATWDWTIDTVLPVATITSGPKSQTNLTSATFKFTSSKVGSTFTCQLDSGAAASCTSPTTYTGLRDGVHAFVVIATDPIGNVSVPATYSWTVDTVAPAATITSGPASLTNSKSATFTFTSNDPLATFKCSRDGGSYLSCTSPKTYWSFIDGAHTVSVEAIDGAGNTSVPVSWTWTVDTVKPVVTITSGPPNPDTNKNPTFTFTATKSGVVFTCTLDSGTPTTCTSPKTYRNLSTGNHTFSVYGKDQAGNQSATVKWTWKIN